jgi:aminoglycoside phosphotransferase (APT) family kinase protein
MSDVEAVLAELCPSTQVAGLRIGPESYSNRLWLAETDEGDLLIRIPGRSTNPEKLRNAIVASRLASEAGVPSPRFRAFAAATKLGHPVVVQEFRPGERASRRSFEPEALGRTLGDWIGRLHSIRGGKFGSILETRDARPWGQVVLDRVEQMLADLPEASLPSSFVSVTAAFSRLAVVQAEPSSLVHRDLYLDNVLIHEERGTCLLDFEHACFQDRFVDFGKLTDLVFERYPRTGEAFFAEYRKHHPPSDGDSARMALSQGLYALTQVHYFNRWKPDLVGFYAARLGEWMRSEMP